MKRLLLPLFLLIISFYASILNCSAQYSNLLDFDGATNGKNPIYSSFISDGTFLYGMTYDGGVSSMGVIFKIKPDGSGYSKMHEFTGAVADGSFPRGSLVSDGTFLYGMTENGGSSGGGGAGVIFKIKPDGTGYAVLLDFTGPANGSNPTGSLIFDGTYLYGMTVNGGTNGMGVIFKIKPDGSNYSKLLDFSGTLNGQNPRGALFYDGAFLYGMTRLGGANSFGVIFKIKTDGSGYSKLFEFNGVVNGQNPYGSLISDGTFLYGMTQSGGANNYGTSFKIKPDGSGYAKLLDFDGALKGRNPYGTLLYRSGFLYGSTSAGGTNDNGAIFKMKPDGTNYAKLYSFTCATDGCTSFGSLISDGTFLYGTTYQGGANNLGTVFKYQYCTTVASSQSVTVCAGQSFTIGTHTYTIGGIYEDTLSTVVTGCDSVVTTNLTVTTDIPPTVSISGVATICNGVSTTLTGGGAISYAWNTGGTTTAITVTPTTSTGYTVTGTDANSCSNTAIVAVTVNSLPAVLITGVATICNGTSTTLTGNGAVSYVWDSGSTTNAIAVSPTTSTGYTVTGTDANSCSNTATRTVTVNYPVSTSQTITICAGQSITVGVNTYTATNTYVDVLTSVLTGCDSTVTTNLINSGFTPSPISISGITTICKGSTTTLTATGVVSYVWTSGPSTDVYVVSPTTSKGYTVTGTDGNSCTSIATTTVTVNSLPAVSITGVTTICNGAGTTLTGTGAVTYAWNSGSTTTSITVSPTSGTSYTVTGTDANSCVNTATATVTVNTLPTVTANPITSTVCSGTNVTLSGGGAITYAWNTGGTTTAITVTPTTSTSYTVTGTDANSCSNFATASITVNSLPIVMVNPLSSTVCAGTDVTLTGGGAISYAWNTGGTTTAITVAPTTSTSYTVTGTDVNSCSNMATAMVTVNSLPTVSITGVTTICNGAGTTLTGTGAVTYAWNSGSTTTSITISPTTGTSYTVTGTDANSCANTATATVTVNTLPTVTVNPISSTVCAGTDVTLTGGGAISYAWNTGGTTTAITVTPTTSTGYTVTGTDANSCSNTAIVAVTVNSLPAVLITGVATICNGTSTTLTGNGAVSYVWDSGSTTNAIAVSPTTSTGYTVTGTDANSCSNTATRTVTVNYPVSTSQTITICAGQSITVGVNTYTATNTYVDVLTSVLTGCDSTVTTNLINSGFTPSPISISGITTICKGSTTTLTATGVVSYVWTSGPSTDVYVVSPTTSKGYTVTGTDGNSCTSIATTTVTVNSLPAVSITGVTTICNGAGTTLTGTGAVTYAWNSGSTTTSITVSPTSGTSYTVTGTDANSCVNTATTTVTVNTLPTVTANPITSTVCSGTNVTLTGGGAITYAWNTGGTTTAIIVTPTTSTGYTVTGTDANSCSNTAIVAVTVNSLPAVSITGVTTICNGTSTTLTGNGAISYVWSTSQSTTAIIVSPTTSTGYTVTGIDANSCSNSATKTVTVNSLPVVSITGVTTICKGSGTTLSGNGAVSYVWSTSQSTTAITISPTTSTGYTVIGTDVNSCSNTATKTVAVNALPIVTANPITSTICSGTSATLTAGGATSYLWNMGGTTTAVTVSPTTTSSYTVTGTDANSCSNFATAMVTVNSLPTVSISGVATICNGSSTTLTGVGAVSYVWSTNQSATTITVSPTTSTGYTVTGIDANSCSNTATKMVTVNSLPSVSIAGSTTICKGNATTLTGGGATIYVWNTGGTTSAITVSPTTNTGYTVTGTDANSCSSIATKTVTVNPLPVVSISGSASICLGSNATLIGSGATTYIWSSGQSTSAITVAPTTGTTYTVTGTNANSCSSIATKTVTVNPLPVVSISGSTTICKGNATTLIGSGATTYIWSSGQSTSAITVAPTTGTTYTVTGTNANSCSSVATKTVTVNPLPDVTTTLTGVVISANQNSATYQWLDCNNSNLPITGATNQSYTATVNGSYAVVVSLPTGCSDTSSCVVINDVGINEKTNNLVIIVYPNPSAGIFTIKTEEKGSELNICNFLGEQILSQKIQNEKTEINLSNQPDGVYFLQVKTGHGTATKKLIIQK